MKNSELHVECLVDFSKTLGVEQTAFGTADVIILKPKVLIIKDLKFGKGVLVHAKNNPQLALYAIGALEKFGRDGIEKIAMYIHQPRRNHISEWIVTVQEIDEFANFVCFKINTKKQNNDIRELYRFKNECKRAYIIIRIILTFT